MKKKYIIVLLLIGLVFNLVGQVSVKKIGKRTKRKAERKTEKAIDNTIDKGFDKVEGLFNKKKKAKREEELLADPEAYDIAADRALEERALELDFIGTLAFHVDELEDSISLHTDTIKVSIKTDQIAIETYRPEMGTIRTIINTKEKTLLTLIDSGDSRKGVKRALEPRQKPIKAELSNLQKTEEAAIISDLVCRKYQVIHPDNSFLELWMSKDVHLNYYAFLQKLDTKSRKLFPPILNAIEGMPIQQTTFSTDGYALKNYKLDTVLENITEPAMFSEEGYDIIDLTSY